MDIFETGHEIMTLADAVIEMAGNMDDKSADDIRLSATAVKVLVARIITTAERGENK